MSEVVRIKVVVNTGFATCKHEDIWEVDKEWWDSLSPEEQEKEMDEYAMDFTHNVIEVAAWVVEEPSYD